MKRLFLIYPVIVSAIVLLFTTACKKEEPATKPSLSTTPVTNITTVTATSGGIIANDGGASITANGVCWGTIDNPTINDSKTTDVISSGQFVSNLAGLTAGTTYHVRSYATNSVGTSYGADMTFLTLGEAPACLTQAATNITATGATLNGTVNANDLSTTVTFEFGTTTSYGSTVTATQNPVTGNTNTNVSANISGLTSSTTYHFRTKAVNSIGTTYGDDKTFTTVGQAPTATTLAATNVKTNGATLNGSVNANNLSTTVTFEYGTTTLYGSSVTATQSPVTGNSNANVSVSISGLTLGTTYHFRTKAANSVGTTYGNDMSFTTIAAPPINGLVGYWSFSGNANDESGNNHNGTVTGAVLTDSREGTPNNAYYFDGISDYIYITNSSLVSGSYVTISLWVKTDGTGAGYPIISGNQNDYNIKVDRDSALLWIVTNHPSGTSPCSSFMTKNGYLPPNQWNHIVLNYDGINLKMFINNVLSKSIAATGQIYTPQSDYLAFGIYFLNGSPQGTSTYKGKLDDVRIYNRGLNTDEINTLYHEGGW